MTCHNRFVILIAIAATACGSYAQAQSGERLVGAGATFPAPLYQKWIDSFEAKHPGMPISYESTGSDAGLRRLIRGEADFAGSDYPPNPEEMQKGGFTLVPSIVGAVVPAYNLPGIGSGVRFTPEVLAGIFLGDIKKWNDPRIKVLNRRLALPSANIVVVHRSDGSGTTYVLSEYLSSVSPVWKARLGRGSSLHWTVGEGAEYNEGVAAAVSRTPNSIGYVEFIYTIREKLSAGAVRNQEGKFVSADLESVESAASTVPRSGGNRLSMVNAQGPGCYPIASFTWFVIPTRPKTKAKQQRLIEFLEWGLTIGQRQAAALGYVALPEGIAERERSALEKIFSN